MLKCTGSICKYDGILFEINEVKMKVNCKALKVSIWISSVSLLLAICFKAIDVKYGNNFTGFMKDIILGIFCSSVVTVFFYSSAYKVEKKSCLNNIGMKLGDC